MQNKQVEIRVYPNKMDKAEYESCGVDAGSVFMDWVLSSIPSFYERPSPLFSVQVNGVFLPRSDWDSAVLKAGDLVECTVEPKGVETIVLAVIAVASAAYAIHLSNQPIPDTYNSTVPKGSSIYDVNAQANRPRLMGTVPVLFGRHKVFPDYLNPPRIEYEDNKQVLYALLSVCAGRCELSADDVFIGDTRATALGDNIDVEIFQPDESVAGNEASKNSYRSVEVGGTDGQSGLRIAGPLAQLKSKQWQVYGNSGKALQWDAEPNLGGEWAGKDFTSIYYDSPGADYAPLADHVFQFFGSHAGFYRMTDISEDFVIPGSGTVNFWIAVFQKLDDDLNDDLEWQGFGPDGTLFDTDFLILSRDRENGFIGPYSAVPDGVSTDRIVLDFRFDSGLCVLDNEGVPQPATVEIEIEITTGESVTKQIKSFTDSTVDQLAFSHEIVFPAGASPAVRIRRITNEYSDIKYKDAVDWVALKADLPSRESYPEFTTMAIRIEGSNTVASGSNNKISCIPVGVHKTFDESGALIEKANSDIASALLKIADDSGHSLDMDELWSLHKKWTERGDTFAGVFDNPTTVWKALQQVGEVGFAEPTLDFGEIVMVRDEPRSTLNYQYQADNILPGSWSMEGSFVDESDSDGYEVEYMDPETWKSATVLCKLPDEEGQKPEQVRAFGITDKTKAYQFGMRKRAVSRYRRVRHSFSTEMDALNSRYLSFDALGIDMPGYSQTGRVEAVQGRTLYLNQDLEWGEGVHNVGVRRPDGTLSGPYQCWPGGDSNIVVIDKDLDFTPVFNGSHEPPYFMFGESEKWCLPVLVKEIKPQGAEKVRVLAYEYSDDVYQFDNAVPA